MAGAQSRPGAGRVFQNGAPSPGKPSSGHGPPTEPSLATCLTQYHINKLSQSGEVGEPAGADPGLEDLDAALNNLEVKLEGSAATDMLVRRGSYRVQVRVRHRDRALP